jgi:uncharacterized protein YggT (Ycf19 family)
VAWAFILNMLRWVAKAEFHPIKSVLEGVIITAFIYILIVIYNLITWFTDKDDSPT